MDKYMHATNLVVIPNFFREISRIADIWGTLDVYRYSKSSEKADFDAIHRDYLIALANFEKTLEKYEHDRRTR